MGVYVNIDVKEIRRGAVAVLNIDDVAFFVKGKDIIAVPDHGDLIDREVVVARLADWSKRLIETYGENDEYVNCLSEVLEGLNCDDVIIPAERSEDGVTTSARVRLLTDLAKKQRGLQR